MLKHIQKLFWKKPWSSSSTTNVLPISLSRVENFEVEFDIQTEANGNYNSAFEFWITEDSLSNENGITTEVMIWTSNSFCSRKSNFNYLRRWIFLQIVSG